MSEQAAAGVRVNVYGRGEATVETGLPVLNRLLARLAETARFDLVLDIEPGDTQAEVEAGAAALGHALAGPLRAEGARGYGSGAVAPGGPPGGGGGAWLRPRGDAPGGGAGPGRTGDERRAALRHERRSHAGPHRRA